MERKNPEFNPNFEKDLEKSPLLKKALEAEKWGPELSKFYTTAWENEWIDPKGKLTLEVFQEVARELGPGDTYVFSGVAEDALGANYVDIPGVNGYKALVLDNELVGLARDPQGEIQ